MVASLQILVSGKMRQEVFALAAWIEIYNLLGMRNRLSPGKERDAGETSQPKDEEARVKTE
jgi:hypothetical protein